jgi:tRNA/tmRNA/rRNA uracil-C5-methylase (TrmA/RlmC/RlmD family)
MTGTVPSMELVTGDIAWGGGCVARAEDGRVVFVRHALPGERVRAEVTGETTSFLRADAIEVVEPSPDRVTPPCPHAGPGRCGGCDWQHIAVPVQRRLKEHLVAEQLRRVAGIERDVVVEEAPGAPGGLGWRTRVRFATGGDGRVGLRRHRSHELEPLDRCPIATPGVGNSGVFGAEWPAGVEVEAFAEADDPARRVISVATSGRRASPVPEVPSGTVVNGRVVRPPGRLRFEVLGQVFEVSAGSFWQVHTSAARVLGQAVLELLEPAPGELAVDLYAGVGLFSVLLGAAVGPDGSVLAVEHDRGACADAVRNARGLPQVEVRRQGVTPGLVSGWGGPADLVVLDPAREGAGVAVMRALASLDPAPRRVAYVSCDPGSFARDLRVMLEAGWSLPVLRAFDLFPMTEHVELVGILEPGPG